MVPQACSDIVERAAILSRPSNLHLHALFQGRAIAIVWDLHDEIRIAGHGEPRADVIAEVDEFLDAAIHDVGNAVDRGAYLDPLRAQREKGVLSFSRDLHGRSSYQLTGCQSDSAGAIAADLLYNALKP